MSHPDRSRRPADGDDAGFTLVEVLVAVVIISVVMLGLGAVFVATASGTDAQGLRQTAVRVATDGLDRVHAVPGPSLATGRTTPTVATQWATRPAGVRSLLGDLPPATDDTAGASPALPVADSAVVDGVTYARSYYVARCQLTTAGTCLTVAGSGTVPAYDVVVAVIWRHTSCPQSTCTYQVSTLVDAGTVDPVFDTNDHAAAPVLSGVADVVQDVGEAVTGPVFTVAGGSGTRTWSASGLPSGVTMTPSGALTGTPSTPAATRTVTVTVSDEFGQSAATSFSWTVNPLPSLTAAAVPVTVGALPAPISLPSALALTGGTGGYTWACASVPAGLSLDPRAGTLSGSLPTAGTVPVSCTVTDARGKTATATLTFTVLPVLVVTNPADASTAAFTRAAGVAFTTTAAGCSVSCTWAATGLPPGVTLTGTTVAGKPTATGVFRPVFTVRDAAGRTVTSTVTWTVS